MKANWLMNKWFWYGVFTILTAIATYQAFPANAEPAPDQKVVYKEYNNYVIFKQSYFHLVEGKDLYIDYRDEHWDLFKYTPTFAAAFGLLAVLDDGVGLFLWNLLNALILLFGVFALPRLTNR